MKEWDAASYHRVSAPQTAWGERVLSRLTLRGDERVVDAGCGTGRLTAGLLRRLPHGRLIAIDRSWNMLLTARANLRPEFGARLAFARVELPHVPFVGCCDLIFSTATFHWVRDHEALFAALHTALIPGGRLFAQCGGGPNLARAHALAASVMQSPDFADDFRDWGGAWEFSSAERAAERMRAAGFVDVQTSLEEAPTTLADETSYREFVTTVIYHQHLAAIGDAERRVRFIDEVTALAREQDPPFTLDYWRLNLDGKRAID